MDDDTQSDVNLKPVNAMTVDVEDYFQVSAFEGKIRRADWDTLPCRVENNTDRVLALFNRFNVHATFFTLGWVAERFPELVRRIVDAGHEIGSHGMEHIRATDQNRAEFRSDLERSKKLLEEVSGTPVRGYRAASFSIVEKNFWALEEVQAAGYQYSSSVNPVRHDLYGFHNAPRFPFRVPDQHLLEVPITTMRVGGFNLPCGGGGYFRLLPYAYFRWGISAFNRVQGRSAVFYFHPWEIDPEQPRQTGLKAMTRLRHYTNLDRMESRLVRLLGDFAWDRMDRLFLESAVEACEFDVPASAPA